MMAIIFSATPLADAGFCPVTAAELSIRVGNFWQEGTGPPVVRADGAGIGNDDEDLLHGELVQEGG